MSKIQALHLNNILIAFLCLIFPILGRAYLPMIGITEIILVPLEIIGIIILSDNIKYGKCCLEILGKHSTNMWLIHGFFIFYYWQNFIYSFNNTFISFIVLLTFSLSCSILIEQFKKLAVKIRI